MHIYPPFSAKEELVDTLNAELHQTLSGSLENRSFIQHSHQPIRLAISQWSRFLFLKDTFFILAVIQLFEKVSVGRGSGLL